MILVDRHEFKSLLQPTVIAEGWGGGGDGGRL